MSRIDIQEVRTFQHALKKANTTMRNRINKVKKAALAYATDTTLSGQAVQASKAYFQENYAIMCESLTEVLDTSEDLLESYLNDFSAQVDPSPTAKVDAELLGAAVDKVKSIRRKQEALQQSLSGSTAGLYEGKAQRLRLDLADAMEQEKILEKYLQFEQSHGTVFQDLVALVMTAKQMMQQLIQDVQFNEKTGTYSMPKGYTQSLQSLKKRLDEVRGMDPKLDEELKDYKVYAVVYKDGNGNPQVMWLLEQNGVGVNNPKLKKYLEQTGKYLDPSAYQIITNDDLNKKINRSWEQGIYYMDGSKYSGALGGVLRTSAYVEDWKGKLDESGLLEATMGLGLSVAAIRFKQPIVKMNENSAQGPKNIFLFEKYKDVLRVTESANPIVDSLRTTGKLPDNFVRKDMAIKEGWRPGKALDNYVSGGQLGGDIYKNTTKILPEATGRTWREADIGMQGNVSRAKQPGTRLLYSNDGLLYITTDHYKTVHFIGKY